MARKQHSSGFVYVWFDRKHKRFYVGSHWGPEDDGYICSSTWMRNAYKRRPLDFKRRVVKVIHTNRADLLLEEYRWLSMIQDSQLGKSFYNIEKIYKRAWFSNDESRVSVSEKISRTNKGRPGYFTGKKHTVETRAKMSKWQVGRKFSDEVRKKLSEAQCRNKEVLSKKASEMHASKRIGMHGRKHTAETRLKMSIAAKNRGSK